MHSHHILFKQESIQHHKPEKYNNKTRKQSSTQTTNRFECRTIEDKSLIAFIFNFISPPPWWVHHLNLICTISWVKIAQQRLMKYLKQTSIQEMKRLKYSSKWRSVNQANSISSSWENEKIILVHHPSSLNPEVQTENQVYINCFRQKTKVCSNFDSSRFSVKIIFLPGLCCWSFLGCWDKRFGPPA